MSKLLLEHPNFFHFIGTTERNDSLTHLDGFNEKRLATALARLLKFDLLLVFRLLIPSIQILVTEIPKKRDSKKTVREKNASTALSSFKDEIHHDVIATT